MSREGAQQTAKARRKPQAMRPGAQSKPQGRTTHRKGAHWAARTYSEFEGAQQTAKVRIWLFAHTSSKKRTTSRNGVHGAAIGYGEQKGRTAGREDAPRVVRAHSKLKGRVPNCMNVKRALQMRREPLWHVASRKDVQRVVTTHSEP